MRVLAGGKSRQFRRSSPNPGKDPRSGVVVLELTSGAPNPAHRTPPDAKSGHIQSRSNSTEQTRLERLIYPSSPPTESVVRRRPCPHLLAVGIASTPARMRKRLSPVAAPTAVAPSPRRESARRAAISHIRTPSSRRPRASTRGIHLADLHAPIPRLCPHAPPDGDSTKNRPCSSAEVNAPHSGTDMSTNISGDPAGISLPDLLAHRRGAP